jgi:hypothetical protein
MRRVVFVTVSVVLLLAAATACGRPATAPEAGPSQGPRQGPGEGPSDRAAIYAAVLLTFIAHSAEGAGAGMPTVVYVFDTTSPNAGPAMGQGGQGDAIPAADQTAILAAIRGRSGVPVSFVASGKDLIISPNGCPQVRDGGVIVTLAPVPTTVEGGTDRVEVGVTGFVACLGAVGLAYVVERQSGGWVVSDTTHEMSIA